MIKRSKLTRNLSIGSHRPSTTPTKYRHFNIEASLNKQNSRSSSPAQNIQPTQSDQTIQPTQSVQPTQTIQSTQTVQPTQTIQPTQTDQPTQTSNSIKKAQTIVKPIKSANSFTNTLINNANVQNNSVTKINKPFIRGRVVKPNTNNVIQTLEDKEKAIKKQEKEEKQKNMQNFIKKLQIDSVVKQINETIINNEKNPKNVSDVKKLSNFNTISKHNEKQIFKYNLEIFMNYISKFNNKIDEINSLL